MAKTGKRLKKAYEGINPDAPPLKLEEAIKQISLAPRRSSTKPSRSR